MAPPVGTLRVGRYFLALIVLLGVLYALVFLPGNRHTPKLGIDLVGGQRVIFKAISPKGAPAPTSSQMTQARQILEDRINGTGVTGATVVVQGGDQLIVEIPGGTGTDVNKLGKAATLNFRGVVAPAVPVSCNQPIAATTTPSTGQSASSSPSASSSASPSSSTSTPTTKTTATQPASRSSAGSGSSSAQAGPRDADSRRLAAAASTTASKAKTSAAKTSAAKPSAAKPSAAKTSAAKPSAAQSSGGTPAASSSTTAIQPCYSDFGKVLSIVEPSLKAALSQTKPSAKTLTSETVYSSLAKSDSKAASAISSGVAYSTLTAAQKQAVAKYAVATVKKNGKSAPRRVPIPAGATVGGLANFSCPAAQTELDNTSSYYVACDDGTQTSGTKIAYLLGKVIVPGKNIDDASAVAPSQSGQGSTDWTVQLKLNGPGTDAWSSWTGAHNTSSSTTQGSVLQCGAAAAASGGFPCADWVGFTLDGQVLSAPQTQSAIGSTTQITGGFDQTTSNDLATQLNYGKLPLSFRIESNESVSATLGSSQLSAAFLAGGIGLILVVIYSLLYYRGLGLVTIASLLVSGGLTYAMLVVLGEHLGFTLDLSGIAGFIVALGITADSFVVFFERIKDEVHEGRSVRVAIPRAWVRARRTVLSADTVSFLAAAILYYFASADVKGFAFTLGMSTILDLVVVFLFTHPIVSLLSRSRAFGSPRFTGLNSVRVGGFDVEDPGPRGKRSARARTTPTTSDSQTAADRAAERRGTTPRRAEKTSTVVLDKPDDVDESDDVDEIDELEADEVDARDTDAIDDVDTDEVETDEVETDEVETDEVETDEVEAEAEPEQPRRRSTPASGTAAERAAARRARARGKTDPSDEKGTS